MNNEGKCYTCSLGGYSQECNIDRASCPTYNSVTPIPVIMQLTDRCNETCSFCWHKDKTNMMTDDMEEKDVDALFDFLEKEYKGYGPYLILTGGEPSMNIDLVMYIMKEVKRRFKYYSSLMISNAVNMLENTEDLFNNYNFKLNLSLPKMESPLFEQRFENVKKYIKMSENYPKVFGYLITLKPEEHYTGIIKELKHFTDLGIANKIIPLFEYQDYNVLSRVDSKDYTSKIRNSIDIMRNLGIIIERPTKGWAVDKIQRTGRLHQFAYFKGGDVHISTRSKFFNNDPIGNIHTGVDFDKGLEFYSNIKCADCGHRYQCKGDFSAFMKNNEYVNNDAICRTHEDIILYLREDDKD